MSAASYGLATPVGSDLVSEGDDVISLNAERVATLFDELRFSRGVMPSGTNIDLMTKAGAWNIPNATIAASLTGTPLPVIFPGNFINIPGTTIVKTQLFTPYGDNAALWWRVGDGINTWEPWAKAGKDNPDSQFYRGFMPNGTDADLFTSNGAFGIPNTTAAESMLGTWPVKFPGVFINIHSTTLAKAQIYMPYSGQAALWWRVGLGFTTYTPWVNAGAPAEGASADVGLANSLHIDYMETFYGGTISTGGVGAVAFRHDHGLNNFNSVIRPLHEARNIPYSLALASRRWDQAENNTVTPAMVNAWVLAGLCEIWNHGASAHNNASGYAANYDYWVNGLAELQDQIPDAFITGVVIPGTGVSGQFDGMGGVGNPQALYNTDAGRLILGNHAVVTGAFPNTEMRPLDGKVRQGQFHYGMESRTSAVIIAKIAEAQAQKKGLQLMMHPSLIDTAGYITSADYAAVLDYVVTERDAGRLAVLSPYELLLADSRV